MTTTKQRQGKQPQGMQRPGMQRPGMQRPGMSLIELVIVVLVMGVMAAVALPRWSGYLDSYRANAAAQQIAADLARTQSLAYSSSSARTIAFNVSQSQYQINGLSDPDRQSATYTVVLNSAPFRSSIVSANFAGQTQLSFDGFGQLIGGGGLVVVRSGSAQKSVIVDAESGKATIP